MIVEGVPYSPFLVRFSTTDGRRRVKTLWCPGPASAENPWLSESVRRYLDGRDDVDTKENVIIRTKGKRS